MTPTTAQTSSCYVLKRSYPLYAFDVQSADRSLMHFVHPGTVVLSHPLLDLEIAQQDDTMDMEQVPDLRRRMEGRTTTWRVLPFRE